jgi:hypothetical protein
MTRVANYLEIHRRIVVTVFLGVMLAAGLAGFRDYGIAWDEPVQRQYGSEVYAYVVHHDQQLFLDRHRYYGPVVELLLYSLEKAFALEDPRSIYLMRHLVGFLMLWAGVVFFYLLCRRTFGSWKLGLLGSALLFLSPRIFAHGFYNTKDVPFLSMFIVGVYTLERYLDARTAGRAVVHGVVCAVLVDTRIVGLLLPALTVAAVMYGAIADARRGAAAGPWRGPCPGLKGIAWSLLAYLVSWAAVTVLLWPTLWRDPLGNFIRVFQGMRNFPWEATVLYLGKYTWSTALPWHYTLVWMAVTTPLAYLVLFGVGLAVSLWHLATPGRQGAPIARRDTAIVLLWVFIPLVYYSISRTVLYDEWRHSFFVYPAVLMIALTGLVWLRRTIEARAGRWLGRSLGRVASAGLIWLVALNVGATATFMLRYHPFQNVFFNSFVGGPAGAQGKFELDYWGLSYRKGLEFLVKHDRQPEIPVYAATLPGKYNADMLRPRDRERLVFPTDHNEARYYITNFRWDVNRFPASAEIYSVKVAGAKLMALYKL